MGINDTLLKYYGSNAFGGFTSSNYPNNSSLSGDLLNNVVSTSDVETILDNFDLHDYIFTDAENNLLTILANFEPSGLINNFADWIKDAGDFGMFLSNLCSNNHDIILYTLQNGPQSDFFSSFYSLFPTEFANMYTALSGQGFSDFSSALDWLVNVGDMNDVNNWLLTNMNCSSKSGILTGIPDFHNILKDWLLTQTDFATPILNGLNDNHALWNYLIGYNFIELRNVIYANFDKDLMLTWFEFNQRTNFIQFVAKETPQYVSQWQSSNATHTMLTYFNFIKSYYGQTAYDNILQLYNNATRTYLDSFTLSEWHIYGNTRIGIYKIKRNLVAVKFTANETGGNFSETAYGSAFFAQYEFNLFYLQRGNKHYELTNHLGNVLTVITDKRLLSCTGDTVQSSFANIVSATDYSPFGAPLAGRTFSAKDYRFGFNGKEKDDETYGEGNEFDYGSRIYDSRLGRWLSTDPLERKYPAHSPYCYAINNPLIFIDPDGEDIILAGTASEKKVALTHLQMLTNDKLVVSPKTGIVYIKSYGTENNGKNLSNGTALIRDLNRKGEGVKSTTIVIGVNGSGNSARPDSRTAEGETDWIKSMDGSGDNVTVNFDPASNPKIMTEDPKTGNVTKASRPNEIGLSHELIHADHITDGNVSFSSTSHAYKTSAGFVTQTKPNEELRTVGIAGVKKGDITENQIRKEQGQNKRGAY